ncbi:hypothetical protein ACFU51_37500, partial [Streptomyces sp. NPDC057430]|uniref:hypothetical protein n=1 Tax=Streptomyces sp. NPDC057430 TaxID=3346131 RepID=UPI003697689A
MSYGTYLVEGGHPPGQSAGREPNTAHRLGGNGHGAAGELSAGIVDQQFVEGSPGLYEDDPR